MSKSKNRKDHKKKVAARNERLKNEKRRIEKAQRDFIMNIIKQEKEKGLFDNNQDIPNSNLDGPVIETSEGPII
jgi:hypothetical protein